MSDVALLELTRSIVLRHQRTEDDEAVAVLPTVHDAVDIDHDALSAIASRYGGTYLRCDDSAPEPHHARSPINHTIAEHLKQLCAARNMPITISEQDSRVVVTANDYAEPTGSLPVVLRVLATLASAELDVPLAVLSYPLDGLDDVRAALLWEATMAPGHFAPSHLRTFVPIAGGDVDVPVHCNRQEGSVRLVVRDGELIERGTPRLLSASLQMIMSDPDRPLVLFLGAGASASCNIPNGNRVRDQALASLTQKPLSSADLVPAFRQWLADHDRWMNDERDLPHEVFERNLTLERVLREEFYALSGRPRTESTTVQRMQRDCASALDRQPEGRQALWKLAAELPRLVIATVNFDQLIEDGMDAEHIVVIGQDSFAENHDLVVNRLRGASSCVPILKIHGSIDDPDSLVADITTTSRGLPVSIAATLDAMLSTAPYLTWVWIGCSMRDADLGTWLAGKSGKTELQEWWVDPLPPKSLNAYAQKRRHGEWAQMDQGLRDRVITETSDRFLAGLVSHVTQLQLAAGGS
jgi:hypothetical protein